MAERSPELASLVTMKARLKRIPGLVLGVRLLSILWRRSKIAVTTRAIGWGTATSARRVIVFEALPNRLVLAVHPQESYVVNGSDRVIGRSLYASGQFDFQKFETACDLIRARGGPGPEAVLIDAGANIGSICIPAVRRGLVAHAIAFELDPANTRLLRINALLNGVEDRIDIRNNAVGAAPGYVTVQHNATNFGDHRVGVPLSGDGVSVPMVALDSLAANIDMSHCILWMDVQGYEAFVLQGAKAFMAAGVPLIAEFSREEFDSTDSFDLFVSLVTGAGYSVFFDLNVATPDAIPLSRVALEVLSDRLTEHGTFTDLLFLP